MPLAEILSSRRSSSAWSCVARRSAAAAGAAGRPASGRCATTPTTARRRRRRHPASARTPAARCRRPSPGTGSSGSTAGSGRGPCCGPSAPRWRSSRTAGRWRPRLGEPRYCRIWMPTMTAPIAHAGMPKKKRTYGYSAMKIRNTASSTGSRPAMPMSSSTPTIPGMTVSSSSRMAKRTRPTMPSTSRPKYQKMASVMTTQSAGSLASGQVNSRHTSPLRTASGIRTRLAHSPVLARSPRGTCWRRTAGRRAWSCRRRACRSGTTDRRRSGAPAPRTRSGRPWAPNRILDSGW